MNKKKSEGQTLETEGAVLILTLSVKLGLNMLNALY